MRWDRGGGNARPPRTLQPADTLGTPRAQQHTSASKRTFQMATSSLAATMVPRGYMPSAVNHAGAALAVSLHAAWREHWVARNLPHDACSSNVRTAGRLSSSSPCSDSVSSRLDESHTRTASHTAVLASTHDRFCSSFARMSGELNARRALFQDRNAHGSSSPVAVCSSSWSSADSRLLRGVRGVRCVVAGGAGAVALGCVAQPWRTRVGVAWWRHGGGGRQRSNGSCGGCSRHHTAHRSR